MKKLFLSIISVFMIICSFSTVFADDYDYFNSSYGTWSYYHISQVNNSTSADYNEVGLSIGGLNFPIPNYTGAVSLVYQFNKSYSGTLTFNYDSSVSSAYKLIYGDYGAKINYSSGSSVNVSITDCTRLEIIVLGSNATKVNSIDYSLSATAGNTQIDYSSKLDVISQLLSYIDNSIEDIETNSDIMINLIDGIEGYIDGLETSLSSISSTLSNIYTALGNSNSFTSNINSIVSNIYLLLNNLYDRFGNSLSSIVDNTDSLETLLTTINSTISSLVTSFNPSLLDIPTYSLSAYMWWAYFNNSGISENTYGYPSYVIQNTVSSQYTSDRRIYVTPHSTYLLAFISNNNITQDIFPYYVLNDLPVTVTYSDRTFGSSRRIELITINNDNNTTASVSFDYTSQNNFRCVPLYLGDILVMTQEMQMITQFFADNDTDYTSQLDNIISLLDDLGVKFDSFNFDGSELVDAIDDLNTAISNLAGNITVTNNVNVSNVPMYSWGAYFFWSRFNNSISNTIYGGYPQYLISNTVTGAYQTNRRVYVKPHSDYIISFFCNVNVTESVFKPYVLNDYSITYTNYDSVIGTRRIENFIIHNDNNNTVSVGFDFDSSTNVYITPFYCGDLDLMTQEMQMITQYKIDSSNPDYTEILDDIYDAINSLDLNVSVNVTNNDVQNITNEFDTNIELVNNVEVNFNNSFESSNNSISSNDLSLNFEPYADSITLYHGIFRTFYNIPLFKYVIIICMVGGVLLVLLG